MARPAKSAKPATKRPVGRPPVHDRERIGKAICDRVANGELVRTVCAELGIVPATVRKWATEDKEFGALYARAREDQAHALAEQALEIAAGDDALTLLREEAVDHAEEAMKEADDKQWYQKVQALRAGVINRDKMRVDALKWMASKIAPRQYGERLQQEVSGPNGRPIEVRVRVTREGRRVTAS